MKSFHHPVPEQAAHAFNNVQDLLEPLLYQCLGTTVIPCRPRWNRCARKLHAGGVDWWLTGSAALAVRGGAVIPRDVDLVVADGDAVAVGDLLARGLIEPVCPAEWRISNCWGRAFLKARVE